MKRWNLPRRDVLKGLGVGGMAALAGPGFVGVPAFAAGKRLTVAVSSDAWNLDVRTSSDVTALNVDKQIYNGLMNYDPDGKLFADLAEGPP